jgi:TolB-like protein
MRRVTVAVVLCGLSVPVVTTQAEAAQDRTKRAAVTAVAVLVFSNSTGDAADDWMGVGIAETVSSGLDSVGGLMVIRSDPSETRARTPNDAESPITIAQVLDASWVVSGAYQRLGDRMRITADLTHVETTVVVQSAMIDGTVDEFFSLQDRLVTQIREGFEFNLDGRQPVRVSRVPTTGELSIQVEDETTLVRGRRPTIVIDGPAPPVAPAVINRDAEGRATVRATRLTEEIRLDGRLDEPVYQTVPALTDFVQQMPNPGTPASEKTEAWILFNEANLYVGGRVWDSAPPSEWIANEMRRDSYQLFQNETFWLGLDTFYDRRNGVVFFVNPLGGFSDFAFANEGNPNLDWNPVWDVRTGRFEGGWTVEMEIPFRTLRYRPGSDQVWGVQLQRNMPRKNEFTYLSPIPISAGVAGIFRASDAATLVGLEVPEASRNLEIKPYGIGGLRTSLTANPPTRTARDGSAGIDVKYGITQNLTADFTYNTDFAQVEVDEQQVNLTRFSLFFPEKREFFLEGSGIFDFARGAQLGSFYTALRRMGVGGGVFGGGNAPTLFYSRQIGLQGGTMVPIVGGGRVTGKIGAFDVGFLNIRTDDEAVADAEMTNFTVARVRRNILRRSSLGALFTNRSVSLVGDGTSQTYGADATFSFYENVGLVAYLARTDTPGREDKNLSYQGRFDYAGDRYGFQAEHLAVEDHFIPEVGFLRRDNFRRTYTTARFSPRPRSLERIRQFRFEGSFDYIEAADTGSVETRQSQVGLLTEFENGDQVGINVANNHEFLVRPFAPAPGVTLPVGGYSFQDMEATYTPGPQRRLTGTLLVRAGEYFSGTIRSVGFSRARLPLTDQFSVEPSVSLNWVDTPLGAFRTDLVAARVNYAFTPRMFLSGFVQYNSASHTVSNNLRLRWEYSPGSELFVVYTEDKETDPLMPDRHMELRNRGFIVKVNRLFRF